MPAYKLNIDVDRVKQSLTDAINREYGDRRNKTKQVAKIADASFSIVDKWFAGDRTPGTSNLIALMADSDEVFAEVCRLAGRKIEAPVRNNNRLHFPHLPQHINDALNSLVDAHAVDDGPVNENMAPVRPGPQGELF